MEFLLILLAGYGLYFSIADATITQSLRDLLFRYLPKAQSLILCPFCLGFWVTMAVAWMSGIHGVLIVTYGLAGAVSSFMLDRIALLLDRLIVYLDHKTYIKEDN